MALFKNVDEIKLLLPVIGTTKFASMLVFINQAERDYIIPNISQAQYDNLSAAYNVTTPSLSAAQTKLLAKCQAALAQYFFYLWIPTAQLSIGDNGIRIATTDTLKTAFEWQIDGLQRSTLKAAGSAMDDLLAYMEVHKTDYALWAASNSYTEFKECFIPSTSLFTILFTPLGGSRLNFIAIRSAMLKVQEFIIQSELGDAFYAQLKAGHIANNASTADKKIIVMVQKALAPLTMFRAITELSVSIDERGILNFDNTNSRTLNTKLPAKDQMLFKLEKSCEADGKAYVQKMKEFLKINIVDYPTYANSSAYDGDTADESFKTKDTDTLFNFG